MPDRTAGSDPTKAWATEYAGRYGTIPTLDALTSCQSASIYLDADATTSRTAAATSISHYPLLR